VQGNDFDYSRNDPSPPVRGIDCDYSRNDPSTPDFSRTLPKPKTTVFGVFAHIFRSKESIATIPGNDPSTSDSSRIFPIFPELSRRLETPCEESIATIPETIRALPIFPELSRRLETPCLVSFIILSGARNRLRLFPKRFEPSRLFPNFPEA
ncbi:hypothetical protein NQ317_004831, partial [Molorchus minor]